MWVGGSLPTMCRLAAQARKLSFCVYLVSMCGCAGAALRPVENVTATLHGSVDHGRFVAVRFLPPPPLPGVGDVIFYSVTTVPATTQHRVVPSCDIGSGCGGGDNGHTGDTLVLFDSDVPPLVQLQFQVAQVFAFYGTGPVSAPSNAIVVQCTLVHSPVVLCGVCILHSCVRVCLCVTACACLRTRFTGVAKCHATWLRRCPVAATIARGPTATRRGRVLGVHRARA